ncbi:DNA-binding protein, excisionase family [Myxococcus xanthus DK 1622]|uniref:DNA-binding protein, excisionase family n=1 Tax=Myxococcus xanthus (strain DK1622) TaxID=246197 RepID=Q1DBC0_MYXXD|nr:MULTISPECIES: excisionase family DNA-binding protein [Myxococcus]ABF88350.1 DNA-binding protein, excisionase family [Myxococcus xanthus DK 1622]NOJ57529.1 excisionase family DNA-binding protein [Myxococcus xanthus]QPM81401.1 excisionase family DNA-binding protein [Myxococcus xanthus]QVW70651.1 excisionase family DNA-binding protein [Myxococcus xanthus DZ2]UEO03222.1 excisionase family DNA-binding protein [Myxococcus xanthus DZ2]
MRAATQLQLPEARGSVDAVAARIGVPKVPLFRWFDAKRLPAHRGGKLWKFKLSEVDDWVRAGGASKARTRAMPVRRTTTTRKKTK